MNDSSWEFYNRVSSVDLPGRLDKIDNRVSPINIGLQNLQTAISEFKKEIKESVNEKFQTIRDEQAKIQEQQSKQQKGVGSCRYRGNNSNS